MSRWTYCSRIAGRGRTLARWGIEVLESVDCMGGFVGAVDVEDEVGTAAPVGVWESGAMTDTMCEDT